MPIYETRKLKQLAPGVVIRQINNSIVLCRDVGCPDFEAARKSREKVWEQGDLTWWKWYRNSILLCPLGKPLPKKIPQGDLPSLSTKSLGLTESLI